MEEEKQLFTELENLIIKFRKLRDRTAIGLKDRYFTVVITLLEQALAYYSHYILGNS